jgi:hypothetical protein
MFMIISERGDYMANVLRLQKLEPKQERYAHAFSASSCAFCSC